MTPKPVEESRLLTSWKEIADFLGVSTKTAQQYEKLRGLPVQRLGNRVRILESELLAWQQTNTTSREWWLEPQFLKWYAISATAVILALLMGIAAYATAGRPGPPVTINWQGSLLTAYDANAHPVWHHQFAHTLMDLGGGTQEITTPWVGDLDNDGQNETVIVYTHVKRESEGWEVYCFSSTGEVRWRLSPTRAVRTAKTTFAPPYVVRSYAVFPSPEKDGTSWTAAAFAHVTSYASVVLVADSKGKVRGEFWHAGHLNVVKAVDLDGDGKMELVAAGVQHGAEQAVLLVLDPANAHGAAQLEPADNPLQFLDLGKGTEKSVVYFPRTQLNRRTSGFNVVNNLDVVGDKLQVSVYEHFAPPVGYLIYSLDHALRLKSLVVSVAYQAAFQQVMKQKEFMAVTSEEEIEHLKSELRVVRR